MSELISQKWKGQNLQTPRHPDPSPPPQTTTSTTSEIWGIVCQDTNQISVNAQAVIRQNDSAVSSRPSAQSHHLLWRTKKQNCNTSHVTARARLMSTHAHTAIRLLICVSLVVCFHDRELQLGQSKYWVAIKMRFTTGQPCRSSSQRERLPKWTHASIAARSMSQSKMEEDKGERGGGGVDTRKSKTYRKKKKREHDETEREDIERQNERQQEWREDKAQSQGHKGDP